MLRFWTTLAFLLPTVLGYNGSIAESQEPTLHCAPPASSSISGLAAPEEMQGIGSSTFEITTSSRYAQIFFNQGLNLLHAFWDFEALRAFQHASKLDPNAAMAYWGIAMAIPQAGNHENAALKQYALSQIKLLRSKVSEKEQLYLDAVLARNSQSKFAGKKYLETLKRIANRFPTDIQAKLFVARAQMSGYSSEGQARDPQQEAEQFVQQVLRAYPKNVAAHHYWVHLMELSPDPSRALPSAKLLPELAPNSGHIVHMPGHIYYLTGQYQQAYNAFIAAHKVDTDYMKAQQISALDNWNYVHNLDYLVAVCAELGRYQEAIRWAKEIHSIRFKQKRHSAPGLLKIGYDGYTAEARVHFRFGNWQQASESLQTLQRDPTRFSAGLFAYLQALDYYAQLRAALARGDVDESSAVLERLSAHYWSTARAERPAYEENFFATSRATIAVLIDLARSLLAGAQNDFGSARDWFASALRKERALGYREPPTVATPMHEAIAWMYLDKGDTKNANEHFRAALRKRPNSGFVFFGLTMAASKASRPADARRYFNSLLNSWKSADADLPQLTQAQDAAKRSNQQ